MTIFDVFGVGFGPSNISVAVALKESFPGLQARFVERRHKFTWHPGLMIPGAEVQVSFRKDLVTLRNPTSEFIFLNYLRDVDSLNDFVNLRSFYPSKTEFNEYYRWVATKFEDADAGISVAPFRVASGAKGIADAGDALGYPIIAKPA